MNERAVVTEDTVRKMLAEWLSERLAAERGHESREVVNSRAAVYERAPSEYASELAPYVFSLLQKHGEPVR